MSDLSIIIKNRAGSRKPFDSSKVTSADWDKGAKGGDGRFTLQCEVVAGLSDLASLMHDDTLEVWTRGTLRYRGLISEINRSREKADSLTISGYSLWQRVGGINTDRQYVYPVDVDVAQVMRDVARDTVTPVYPTLEVSAGNLGRTASSLDGVGKTVGDVYSDLLRYAGDRAAYGIDRNPSTGAPRLFLRAFEPATPRHILSANHERLTKISSEEQSADICTRLRIQGGTPRFPNLVPNASFERLRLSSEQDNLIRNGGLDEPNPAKGHWHPYNGASFKTGSNSEGSTYAGDRMLETDAIGEGAYQRRENLVKIVPGHDYALGAHIKREAGSNQATGKIIVQWLNSANQTIHTDIVGPDVVVADSVVWRRVGDLLRAPANAAGFQINIECVDPSLLWDAISFYDTSLVRQSNWNTAGSGTIEKLDWAAPGALHGGYCVRIKVNASDSNDNDVVLWSDRFPVQTRQRLRASFWIKSPVGVTSNPKIRLKCKLFNPDGGESVSGTQSIDPLLIVPAGLGFQNWTRFEATFDLPFFEHILGDDAKPAQAKLGIILRGPGEVMLDGVSCRDAAADPNEPYLADGAYTITLGPRDVLASDHPLYNAEELWGLRFATEQIDSVVGWGDAAPFARAVFESRAKLSKRPEITLVGMYAVNFEPGECVALRGVAANLADGAMPILRIKERFDNEGLSSTLELEREKPTTEAILRDLRRSARFGAGAATGSVGGGSGSGGSTGGSVTTGGSTGGGDGTVTSVGLSAPAGIFSVSSSPVTTAGTLSLSLLAQPANTFLGGPPSGANAVPTARPLVTNDLPALGVTSDKLAAAAVTRAKIGTAAVGTNEIALGAVTTGHIAEGSVVGSKLENIGQAGSYTNANITLDAKGRVIAASNGSGGSGGTNATHIQGRPVSATAPTPNQVLKFDGNQWLPSEDGGGGGGGMNHRVVGASGGVLAQTDDAILLSATSGNTSLLLRGNLTASKTFVIKRIDDTTNLCSLNINGFDDAVMPDAGITTVGGGSYNLPPRSGLVLSAYVRQTDNTVLYSIVATFNISGGGGGNTGADTRQNLRVIEQASYQIQDDDEVLICRVPDGLVQPEI